MRHRQLGKAGPKVSSMGLGCMGMSENYGSTDEGSAIEVIRQAYREGINFFDTADIYGNGQNEVLLGKAIKGFRDQIIIATKCGLELNQPETKVNNHPDYIKQACYDSLKRLDIETIDLYYLHRYTPDIPIEISMRAMAELIKEGKIRYVGLSEVDAETIERAHKVLGNSLIAIQTEYSIVNRAQAEAVLPTCKKLGIAFVAWSPLGRGLLSGKIKDADIFKTSKDYDFRRDLPQFQDQNLQHNLRLIEAIENLAQKKGCSAAQLSLAWLLAQDKIIPIPGTKKLEYLLENIKALDLVLASDELDALNAIIKENPIKGARYPEALMKVFNLKI
ncbi:MAG: aldo/keto reductase [Chlamydiota bacterium]